MFFLSANAKRECNTHVGARRNIFTVRPSHLVNYGPRANARTAMILNGTNSNGKWMAFQKGTEAQRNGTEQKNVFFTPTVHNPCHVPHRAWWQAWSSEGHQDQGSPSDMFLVDLDLPDLKNMIFLVGHLTIKRKHGAWWLAFLYSQVGGAGLLRTLSSAPILCFTSGAVVSATFVLWPPNLVDVLRGYRWWRLLCWTGRQVVYRRDEMGAWGLSRGLARLSQHAWSCFCLIHPDA